MRKAGSILLLGLMLQYTFGLHIVYGWHSFAMKQLMKTAIATGTFHHSEILILTLPVQQFNHSQDDYFQEDEIELDGKMYDVVSARQQGNHIIVQAICDDDETRLVKDYQQVMVSTKQSLPDKGLACLKSYFSLFVVSIYPRLAQVTTQNEKSRLLHDATNFPVSLYAKVPKPPPRCA